MGKKSAYGSLAVVVGDKNYRPSPGILRLAAETSARLREGICTANWPKKTQEPPKKE